MTKGEFLTGWAILTAQPWGRQYRGTTSEATIQIEFYYKKFERGNVASWQQACEQAATGDRWPSVSDLMHAMREYGGFAQDPARAIPEYRGPCLTKEEFGLDLNAALSRCAGVQHILLMISTGVTAGRDVSHLSAQYQREKEKAKELAQAASINGEDAARLARDYPWLLA